MNNEIKEILDRLERIDHKEYSCGFEFADSGSFDEDCRCFEERKKMANYITNLQQENQKQKEFIKYLEDEIKRLKENDIYQPLQKMALATHEHILQKYKSIIGDDK